MANKIIIKKSSIGDKVPLPGDLEYGELALNYTDGNLFYKNSSNVITTIASNKFISVTGNVTGGNLIAINSLNAGNITTTGTITATGNVVSGNVVTLGQVSAAGNITGDYILGNASQLSNVVAYKTVTVPGYSNLVANTSGTLNIEPGPNVFISTNAATGTLYIDAATSGLWLTGGSMGLITEAATEFYDFSTVTIASDTFYDLGFIVSGGIVWPSQFKLPAYAVIDLPPGAPPGSMIFVTDASGGSIPAFSDGINWRRVDDRSIVA